MKWQARLGAFDLTMIIISLVIGIGIFKTPVIVAQKTGSVETFFLAWALGGIVSICGALTFAEIGSRYPVAGGFYKTFSYCYHPAYAFMLNWVLLITNAGSAAGVALIGAAYLRPLLPFQMTDSLLMEQLMASLLLSFLFFCNWLGIRMGSRVQNLLSLSKILMILLLCTAIFFPLSHQEPAPPNLASGPASFWLALGAGLISIFFTFGGYHQMINFGADVKEPQRNVPRAVFIGMGIVLALYLMINGAYYARLGFSGMQESSLIAADLAKSFFGDTGFRITALTIFLSAAGFVNVSILSNPRVYYAMASEGSLPSFLARYNEKTQTFGPALITYCGIILISVFALGTFEKIVNYVMFIDSISLVSAGVTIFILRKKQEGANYDGYRIRAYPWIPLLFIAVLSFVTVNVLIADAGAAAIGFVLFLAGYPLFVISRKLFQRRSEIQELAS